MIKTVNLKSYNREIKKIWTEYRTTKNLNELISTLDELFVENEYYANLEPKAGTSDAMLQVLTEKDIELICYEWIKPQSNHVSG